MIQHRFSSMLNHRNSRWPRAALAHGLGAGVALGLIVGFAIASGLLFSKLRQQSRLEAEARHLIKHSRELHSQHALLLQQRLHCEEELQKKLAAVPASADASAFLHSITEAFMQSGLVIQDAQPCGERSKVKFDEIEVLVRATGNYRAVFSALLKTTQLPFRNRVGYLSITQDANGGDELGIEVKVLIPIKLAV